MALTDAIIEQAQPKGKFYHLTDERGLSVMVMPSGGKRWRFRYRFDGKEKMLSMGVSPDVSLSQARERRTEARRLLKEGTDPSVVRREAEERAKAEAVASAVHTPPRLIVFPDGIIEIWIGRKALRMNEQEARELRDMLSRVLGGYTHGTD